MNLTFFYRRLLYFVKIAFTVWVKRFSREHFRTNIIIIITLCIWPSVTHFSNNSSILSRWLKCFQMFAFKAEFVRILLNKHYVLSHFAFLWSNVHNSIIPNSPAAGRLYYSLFSVFLSFSLSHWRSHSFQHTRTHHTRFYFIVAAAGIYYTPTQLRIHNTIMIIIIIISIQVSAP